MRIVVQKYGGSSVSTVDKIREIARHIALLKETGVGVVVVVSAMGNTTDELIALAHDVCPEPDRREMDMLLSVGERVSMALLAIALRSLGVAAVSLTGSQSGIITNESHTDASIVEVRPTRVLASLENGEVVIVAGFQGVSRDREVTTLGRGGSDTTAVAMAAALKADCCEIYTDVDGIYSADPNIVPRAQKIERMTLDQAATMAGAGAKVLYEDAVAFARSKGIEIVVKVAHGPGSGTKIVTKEYPVEEGVLAIASDVQVSKVEYTDPETALKGILEAASRVRLMTSDAIYFDTRHLRQISSTPSVEVAIISVIGACLLQSEVLNKASQALALSNIPAKLLVAEEHSIRFELSPSDVREASAILHATLIETKVV